MPHKRGPWSTSEDANLLSLVHHHGPQNWVRISQNLGSRSPKQCRERYHQNLKPSLNHEPITPQEGELIESLVKQIGRRWADISRRLPGRSDNAVKNWWNGGVNRRRRVVIRREGLSKPVRDFALEARPFLQPHLASLADRRTLTAAIPRMPLHAPLTSPVRSEVSMPESMGDTPSLVSDHGSQQTMPSPGRHIHFHHHGPPARSGSPGVWYQPSAMASKIPIENMSMLAARNSPPRLPPATDFGSVRSKGSFGQSSEISSQKALPSSARFMRPNLRENVSRVQPQDSTETTSGVFEMSSERGMTIECGQNHVLKSHVSPRLPERDAGSNGFPHLLKGMQTVPRSEAEAGLTPTGDIGNDQSSSRLSSISHVPLDSRSDFGQLPGPHGTIPSHSIPNLFFGNNENKYSDATEQRCRQASNVGRSKMTLSSILL